jgi:hypothetical protein
MISMSDDVLSFNSNTTGFSISHTGLQGPTTLYGRLLVNCQSIKDKSEDTKVVMRSRKSKDRQYNSQMKENQTDKQWSTIQYTKTSNLPYRVVGPCRPVWEIEKPDAGR